MKLLLVNAPEGSQGGVSNPVLGLLYLASYVKDIAEVDYIDGFIEGWQGVENKIIDFKPDVVGTSILTPARHSSLKVLELAKRHGATTICGGAHATAMSSQIIENYPYVNYVVEGEGEKLLRDFLTDKSCDTADELDIDSIPYPAWNLAHLESDRYIGGSDIRVPIIASRGCSGHCAFCSTWRHWKKYRVRSAENVVGEIEYIIKDFNKHHFVFEDDSISCNLEVSKEIMRLIIERNLNIRFFATMRADGIDKEFCQLLKQAGCYGVSIGFESGSQKILDIMKKDTTVEQNIKAALMVKEAGLSLCALMIINSVGENHKTRQETQNFLNIIKPENQGYLCEGLWILPNTHFYYKLKKHGFITDDFWLGSEPVYFYKGELNNLYG